VGTQDRAGRVEKRKLLDLPGLELRPLGRPARSQSLIKLSRLLVKASKCKIIVLIVTILARESE
jgi:hypothetical protein